MNAVAARFGVNLRRARKGAGLSQEALAMRAALHRTHIGLLERGERLARIDTAVKLAGSLEIDAGALFDGIAWEPGDVKLGRFKPPRRVPSEHG